MHCATGLPHEVDLLGRDGLPLECRMNVAPPFSWAAPDYLPSPGISE
jgi:hypothetical protein